jgi:hypothetical protein
MRGPFEDLNVLSFRDIRDGVAAFVEEFDLVFVDGFFEFDGIEGAGLIEGQLDGEAGAAYLWF